MKAWVGRSQNGVGTDERTVIVIGLNGWQNSGASLVDLFASAPARVVDMGVVWSMLVQ